MKGFSDVIYLSKKKKKHYKQNKLKGVAITTIF